MGAYFSRPLFLLFHRMPDKWSSRWLGSDLSDLNTSVILPPEILDKILEEIVIDWRGRRTLLACALVATWWTGPSQRRLFSSVTVGNLNYGRWMEGVVISGSKVRLLGHVRYLKHCRCQSIKIKYRMRDLAQDSGEYLSALRNLRGLDLFNIRIEHIGEEGHHACFSAFRDTLTYLSLNTFTTSFSTFVTLVGYFPNLTTLELLSLALEPDEGPVPLLSRPLRGKVHIYARGFHPDHSEFLSRFSTLDLEYEELSIDFYPMATEFLESRLQISARTVEFLRLVTKLHIDVVVSIRDFRQLQELELTIWPQFSHEILFSSITSTELRKITFRAKYMDYREGFTQQVGDWALVDKQLCGLVDRLRVAGYRHTLEVELRLFHAIDDPGTYPFAIFLPKFREKGVVTITDTVHGARLLHSSAHTR